MNLVGKSTSGTFSIPMNQIQQYQHGYHGVCVSEYMCVREIHVVIITIAVSYLMFSYFRQTFWPPRAYSTRIPRSARSTDALYTLRDLLVEKKEYAWLTSVDNALANSFLKQKEWRLACAALDNLKTSIPAWCVHWWRVIHPWYVHVISIVHVLIMLRCMYIHDYIAYRRYCICLDRTIMPSPCRLPFNAKSFHDKAESCFRLVPCNKLPSCLKKQRLYSTVYHSTSINHWILEYIPIQIRINDGLLSFAYSHYDAAMTHFRKSIDMLQSQAVANVQ